MSKVESGRLDFEEIEFTSSELGEEVVALFKPRADSKRLTLRYRAGADLPATMTGDPVRLRQVLLNLVGNADEVHREGGVDVSCELLRAGTPGARLHFRVRTRASAWTRRPGRSCSRSSRKATAR